VPQLFPSAEEIWDYYHCVEHPTHWRDSNMRSNRTTILSPLPLDKNGNGDVEDAELLMHVSPVAGQHLNFYGRYEFSKRPDVINLDALIQALARRLVTYELAAG
jgi:hypothetical protein